RTCGSLLVGGFHGTEPTTTFAEALRGGTLGGAILFKRNLGADVLDVADLTRHLASLGSLPPILAVDQEGGRVARLKAPFVAVPPMLALAKSANDALIDLAARAQAEELRALGFSTGFSPVLDVSTNPDNPVIGDRAFGSDPEVVARLGVRFGLALQAAGVFACAKHYPGHGDTELDSHFALPKVARDAASIERIELLPFAAAARAGFAAMMSAHVVYPNIDGETPATLSSVLCTDILRKKLGFSGVLFSDDLEMRALSARMGVEESAVRAVDAGCDALLICSDEDLQRKAHAALVRRAEANADFRVRCEEAAARVDRLRHAYAPKPLPRSELARAIPSDAAKKFAEAASAAGIA
ncbi:MAG: beta-N-acetylhexosaminidase, partial [Polyangiaceae bacterium]